MLLRFESLLDNRATPKPHLCINVKLVELLLLLAFNDGYPPLHLLLMRLQLVLHDFVVNAHLHHPLDLAHVTGHDHILEDGGLPRLLPTLLVQLALLTLQL